MRVELGWSEIGTMDASGGRSEVVNGPPIDRLAFWPYPGAEVEEDGIV